MLIKLFITLTIIIATLLGVIWVDGHTGFLTIEILEYHIVTRVSVALLFFIFFILILQLLLGIFFRIIVFRNSFISWLSPDSIERKLMKFENFIISVANGDYNKAQKIIKYFSAYSSSPELIDALEFYYARIAKIEIRKNLMLKFINKNLFKEQALTNLIEIFEKEHNVHLLNYYCQEFLKVSFSSTIFHKLIQNFIDNKQYKEALTIVREARLNGNINSNTLDEIQANLFYLIAQKAFAVGNLKKANKYCSLSLELISSYLHSLSLAIFIAIQSNETDHAIKIMRKLWQLEPDFKLLRYFLNYMNAKQHKSFIKLLADLGISKNDNEQAQMAYIYAHILESNYDKAKELISSLRANAASCWGYIFSSLIALHENNLSGAIKDIHEGMAYNVSNVLPQSLSLSMQVGKKECDNPKIKFELPTYFVN